MAAAPVTLLFTDVGNFTELLPRAPHERAQRIQTTVRQRFRAGLQRIAVQHPGLADHLSARVRTGTLCAYQRDPERPVVWDLSPSGRG